MHIGRFTREFVIKSKCINAAERTCSGACLIKSVWAWTAFSLRRNIFVSIRPFTGPSEANEKLFYRFSCIGDAQWCEREISEYLQKRDLYLKNIKIYVYIQIYLKIYNYWQIKKYDKKIVKHICIFYKRNT